MSPVHWHRYPYLFLVIPLIMGIIVGQYLSWVCRPVVLYSSLFIFILLFFLQKRGLSTGFCISVSVLLFLTGAYNGRPNIPEFNPGESYILKGRCEQRFSPQSGVISTQGIHVYVQTRDSFHFTIGDALAFTARLYPLTSTGNLHEFDYNHYLRHQNIQAKAIPTSPLRRTGHVESIYSYCHKLQGKLLQKLTRILPDSTTRNVIAALCLGARQDLSPNTTQLFQITGTIHLLAISGLHMGALYGLFLFFLHRCGLRNKKYELCLIPLLWFITMLTGLSPSACRAATILSFITIGRAFQEEYIPLNALAAAAFYTLLIRPDTLYSVSFQMSYAAYAGIMLIYPLIIVKRKNINTLVWKIYALFCISFSAQIVTLPITAYYFHTINLNSVIINILAVPLATLLLYIGVVLLVLPSLIGSYFSIVALSITHVLLFCLQSFSRITINIPDIYPTTTHLFLIYLIITLCIFYRVTKNRKTLSSLCYITCVFVFFTYGYTFYQQTRQEIIIYNRYQKSTILLNYNGFYSCLKNTSDSLQDLPYLTANRLQALPPHEGFIHPQIRYVENVLYTPKRTITFIDPKHPNTSHTDVLVVTGNAYPTSNNDVHLPRLKQIILDHSNSPSCIKAWEQYCSQERIPLFKTNELGSIVISLK